MSNIRGLYDDKKDDSSDDEKDSNNRYVGGIGAQGGGRSVMSDFCGIVSHLGIIQFSYGFGMSVWIELLCRQGNGALLIYPNRVIFIYILNPILLLTLFLFLPFLSHFFLIRYLILVIIILL